MSSPENWKQHPKQSVVLCHDSDNLDPLENRFLDAEDIILDILEDSTIPHGEEVRIMLVDGSPW